MTLVEIFDTVEGFKAITFHRLHWKKDSSGYRKYLIITGLGAQNQIARLAILLKDPRKVGFPGRRKTVGLSIDKQIETILEEHFPYAIPGEWLG